MTELARPTRRLGDVTRNYDAKRVPISSRERAKRRGPYPYYGAATIMDHIDDFLFDGRFLLVAEDGSVEDNGGRPVLQLPQGKLWVNNHAHILQGESDEDTRYLYYALQTIKIRPYLTGSVQYKLTQANLNRIEIPYPGTDERKAIASILGALDDKIELNRRMNKTLEAIARALFKSWFVDFDPVRAKMRGEKPWGMDAATAALFPDRLIESEIGEVPEGWAVGTLGDLAENPRRGIQPEQIAPDTPYIALEHMPSRSIALGNWTDANGVESNKFQFEVGDILFGKLRPYFHKVGVAPLNGVCTTDILVIKPRRPEAFGYVLGVASSEELVAFATARSTGTKMPRTNWQDLASFQIAIPPNELLQAFDELARACVGRIRANIMETKTLSALRDTLLPKLLTGEVCIPATQQVSR